MTPLQIAPYRIAFLPSRITAAEGSAPLRLPVGLLVEALLFDHLLTHPEFTVHDPEDTFLTSNDGAYLDCDNEHFHHLLDSRLRGGRRDEVLWFEFGLGTSVPTKLACIRNTGEREEFAAVGQGPSSDQFDALLRQWCAARGLAAPAPFERFGPAELENAATCIARAQKDENNNARFVQPNELVLPFYLALYKHINLYTWEKALQLQPDCPWALRQKYLASRHQEGENDNASIHRAVELAPNYAKGQMSFANATKDLNESLHAASFGAYLHPISHWAQQSHGHYLGRKARWLEACRVFEQACEADPTNLSLHCDAMHIPHNLCRPGARLKNAEHHRGFVHHLVNEGIVSRDHIDLRKVELNYSNALLGVGRYEEAVELRSAVLHNFPLLDYAKEELKKWEEDASYYSDCCIRDAYFRGDPGLVRAALGAEELRSAQALSIAIDAEIALGREDRAAALYALNWEQQLTVNPVSAARGAKALALVGETRLALERGLERIVGFPGQDWQSEANRTLRLLACHPLAAWSALVDEKLESGAQRVAMLHARNAADFHPEAANSPAIAQWSKGLNTQAIEYTPDLFAELRNELSGVPLSDLDGFFAEHETGDLGTADRLASRFTAYIDDRSLPEGDEVARSQFQSRLLWALAESAGRYLALTTQAPNPLGGGYRQMLDGLLSEASTHLHKTVPFNQLRGLLIGLERLSASVDEWWLDELLLRIEQALGIELAMAGHLLPLTEGLPAMTKLLRGSEKLGLELRQVFLEHKAGTISLPLTQLAERCFRATGRLMGKLYSELAVATTSPEDALDACQTAILGTSFSAAPAVHAAKLLLEQRKGRQAFDALTSRLSEAGEQWVTEHLAPLAPLWRQNQMPCPFELQAAIDQGAAALSAGNPAQAADCYLWAACLNRSNEQLWHHLGIARARAGRFHEALAAFGCANSEAGAQMAANDYMQTGNFQAATVCLEIASPWFKDAQPWLALGYCASASGATATALSAYDQGSAYGPISDPAHMNTYLGLLDDVGQYKAIEQLMPAWEHQSGSDPAWAAQITHHKACAALGTGNFAEATQLAEEALSLNQLPENQAVFAETLRLAQAEQKRPLQPLRNAEQEIFHLLEEVEVHEIHKQDAAQAPWCARRAHLRAARYRFESDNDVVVTSRAFELAAGLISASHGTTDLQAAVCRTESLKVREDWMFPIDTPARLGVSPTREELKKRCFPGGLDSLRDKLETAHAAAAAVESGDAGDPDPEVFPGQPIARLSDYVNVMKGMQAGDPMGALGAVGLDMMAFGQVSMQWSQAMQEDPTLQAKFGRMMA